MFPSVASFFSVLVPPPEDVRGSKEKMQRERKQENMFLEKWHILSSEPSFEVTSVSDDGGLAGSAVSQILELVLSFF